LLMLNEHKCFQSVLCFALSALALAKPKRNKIMRIKRAANAKREHSARLTYSTK